MPHDKNGKLLSVGDDVVIPVREVTTFEVMPSEAAPDEHRPQIMLVTGEPKSLVGEITHLYEGDEACNAQFKIPGTVYEGATFNTRLVEKIEKGAPVGATSDNPTPDGDAPPASGETGGA